MRPAQILDFLADEQTWIKDGGNMLLQSGRNDGLRLTTSMPISRDQIPTAAQRFLGAEAKVVQHISSDPVADAADAANVLITAEIPGAPIDVRVDISLLRATDDFTELHARITTSCPLPLVGGMVESSAQPYVETMISKGFDKFPAP
ncbi:DUF2505 domain-containing protein [Brevibacterium aurantiacum]|uniref:DUF2505 domain-containing protein n=2 Tax=Brevibacterium aurantiacum TaxID=273384 RepID=A0A2H1KY57_BREAU|nr:Protein of unknown function (DUF2505) [Brevibacterium aurantiacum]